MSSSAYRIFDAHLVERHLLTPNMARLVFGGSDLSAMTTLAPDQRIKLFFPREDGAQPAIPNRPDWYQLYKSAPPSERAPMRTYTIRAVDAAAQRLTVDFVVHGDNGPASRWAMAASLGDRLQISAPNGGYDGAIGGFDWEPPDGLTDLLIIGDETALPAIAGILEQIATWSVKPRAQVSVEVPLAADAQRMPSWDGLDLRWMAREPAGHAYGSLMIEAALGAEVPASAGAAASGDLAAMNVDKDILWDRAEQTSSGFYGWVAGETAAVSRIRTHFVLERAIDRRRLTMMGYWRHGKPHA